MWPFVLTGVGKVKGFFSKLFSSKVFWMIAAAAALAIGGYILFNRYVDNKVDTAVTATNTAATVQTYKAAAKIDEAARPVNDRYDRAARATTQGYANARAQIQTADPTARETAAPDLVLDALNAVDRLRAEGAVADGLPAAAGPVG